jgi:cell wall assembly regulator SMI1
MAMSLVDIIKTAQSASLLDENGDNIQLERLPPASVEEIEAFAALLPCPLPDDVHELLAYTRGFEDVFVDRVDFTGESMLFGQEEIFPHGVPIASDGCGNFWVVDLTEESTRFGPVYFACHDAPIILYQSDSLADFLIELFRAGSAPHQSLIDDVHEDRLYDVWRKNPGVLSYADCSASSDLVIQEFVQKLDPTWSIIDLRDASPGMGFSWGRYGPNTELKRHNMLPIFAYRRPKGWLQRLFG